MKFPTVVLYDLDGYELAREEEVEGMKRARERAVHLLSEDYARMCETTHERMGAHKVCIFEEGAPTGHMCPCLWDKVYRPQKRT